MKITMLKSAPGSVDGIRVADYEAGKEYDLCGTDGERSLARVFVDEGLATEAMAKKVPDAAEPIVAEHTAGPGKKSGKK